MPTSEQDRGIPRDEERIVEEIRRLFERYRETARHAADDAAEKDQRAEPPVLTLR